MFLLGVWRSLKCNRQYEHWILLSFFVAFYILLGTNYRVLTRYALPLIPVILLYASIGVRDSAQLLGEVLREVFVERLKPYRFLGAFIVLGAVVLYQPLKTSLAFDTVLGQPDTRVQARNWLLNNLQQPQAVGVGPRLGQIKLPAQFGQLVIETGPNNMSGRPPEKIEIADIDFRTKNINTYANLPVLKQLGIRYIVLYGGMPLFANPDWEFAALRKQQAVPVFHASPLKANADIEKDMGQFDVLDAFYLPYDKFDAFVSPGPDVTIFDISGSGISEMPN